MPKPMRSLPIATLAIVIASTCTLPVFAQCRSFESRRIVASDGALEDRLGRILSASGDFLMAGVPDVGDAAGAVYFYRLRNGAWREALKIENPAGAENDRFGAAVDVEGDRLIIGSPQDRTLGIRSGSALVYEWQGAWNLVRTLVPPDRTGGEEFGRSVAIAGSRAVVGAPGVDDNGRSSGAVYACAWDGVKWEVQQKIVASDGQADDRFGQSVDMNGDGTMIVVGAMMDDDNGINAGAVYVYRFDGATWTDERKILASDGSARAEFGEVTVDGDVIVVVASCDDHDETRDDGSAYVFRYDGIGWVEEQKLLPVHDTAHVVGRAAVRGNRIVFGAGDRDVGRYSSGAAYEFRWTGTEWVEERKLLWSGGGAVFGESIGSAVAIGPGSVLVGSQSDDTVAQNAGAIYEYDISSSSPCECGTVNRSAQLTDVLFVRELAGDAFRVVKVIRGTPFRTEVHVPPAGPEGGKLLLWGWRGDMRDPRDLVLGGELVGCTVNPTPLHGTFGRQPFRSVVSVLPFRYDHPGLSRNAVFTLQGLIRDNGAANGRGISVTNAVTVRMVE